MSNIDMIYSQIVANLNYDCLEYLFSFLTPRQWIRYAQESETCNTIAASSKDFQHFTLFTHYFGTAGTPSFEPNEKALEFGEFLKIFEFVAPKLKFAKIHTKIRFRNGDPELSKVCVSFGRFSYSMIISKPEEEKLMKTFLTQTKVVQKFEVNACDEYAELEWRRFCQDNPLEHFSFFSSFRDGTYKFFKSELIFMLPCSVERIEFNLNNYFNAPVDIVRDRIAQFWNKRRQRLSCLHIDQAMSFSLLFQKITEEVSNYADIALQELCLKQQKDLSQRHLLRTTPVDYQAEAKKIDLTLFALIAKLTNLKKLSLSRFTMRTEPWEKIAENCKLIRCLKLLDCDISEGNFRVLISMPSLIELHISAEALALFKTKLNGLEKLAIHDCTDEDEYHDNVINVNNLTSALKMMPNLSTLKFNDICMLKKPVASAIKQIIHSRGQKIVLYTTNHTFTMGKCTKKVGEIAPSVSSKNEFEIVVSTFGSEHLPGSNLIKLINEA